MTTSLSRLILGTLVIAWVATMADYVWYEVGIAHRMVAGLVHGAVLLTAVGGVLGWAVGRTAAGLPLGTIAGIAGALAYYALQPVIGQIAMLAAWAALWVVLALLYAGRLRGDRPRGRAVAQGALAAALSGLAFWLVVDQLWGRAPAEGRDYLRQFLAWTAAWAPGVLAIGLPAPSRASGT